MSKESFGESGSLSEKISGLRKDVLQKTKIKSTAFKADLPSSSHAKVEYAPESLLRTSIVDIARGYVGKAFEEGRNNHGQAIKEFMPDGKSGRAWCAAFATACVQKAYDQTGIMFEGRKVFQDGQRINLLNARTLAQHLGTLRKDGPPIIGDFVFFERKPGRYHVGLVVDPLVDGSFRTVEGNIDADPTPGIRREGVGILTHRMEQKKPKIVGFASPLLPAEYEERQPLPDSSIPTS